jgi:hypothetical protein
MQCLRAGYGPSRHFAAAKQVSRFWGITDMAVPAGGFVSVVNDPTETLVPWNWSHGIVASQTDR